MASKENYLCRICGLRHPHPPWGDDGHAPSFEICDCCGAEFGYHDATIQAIRNYRDRWLSEGAIWFISNEKPNEWSLEDQLKQIPNRFL
jgi:hypothetical protein